MTDDLRKDEWLNTGERGTSSETIFEVMADHALGMKNWGWSTPQDPSDFYRCYTLLQLFPEWKSELHKVADKHPNWKPIIDNWDELCYLLEEELQRADGKAPKLYRRLTELNSFNGG
jgi:hypothetical protein